MYAQLNKKDLKKYIENLSKLQIIRVREKYEVSINYTAIATKENIRPEAVVEIWKMYKLVSNKFNPPIPIDYVFEPKPEKAPKKVRIRGKTRSYNEFDSDSTKLMIKSKAPLTEAEINYVLESCSQERKDKILNLYNKGCTGIITLAISTGEDKGLVKKLIENLNKS